MESVKFSELAHFQEKQLEAWYTLLDSKTKYELFGGSMGPGKSYTLRWCAVGFLLYLYGKYGINDFPVGLFSKDYPTLRDRQLSKISQEFPEWLGSISENKLWGLSFNLYPKYGSGHIMLRNLDDPSKYKSTEFVGEFVEELTENDFDKFKFLRTRLRYPNISEVKFMGATNPGGVGHGYCRRYFVDKSSDDTEQDRFFYVHSTVYDNKYQTEEYVKQLESLPEKEKQMYLFGSWDVFEGQYFPEFNRNLHVIPMFTPKKEIKKYGGMDWGRTAPFCFLASMIKKETWEGVNFNRLITYGEVYGTEKSPKEWGDIINVRFDLGDFAWVRGDPAMFSPGNDGSTSIADQFNSFCGVYIQPANNDRVAGWELLHHWLSLAPDGLPYWMITENCKNLIRTLPELIHDENHVEDVDTEGEDHAPDAQRYIIKHLKWIDARVGGTHQPSVSNPRIKNKRPLMKLDLDSFGSATVSRSKRDWGVK